MRQCERCLGFLREQPDDRRVAEDVSETDDYDDQAGRWVLVARWVQRVEMTRRCRRCGHGNVEVQ